MKDIKEELEKLKIVYIGDELKFQRLYYNYTHNVKLELGDCNAEGNYEVLGVKLAEYLYKDGIITDKKEEGISDKVLRVIEENNYNIYPVCKGNRSSVQDPSTHYFGMFYMLKIYGYLDDYDIFKLFEKYDVLGELKKLKKSDKVLSKKKEILLMQIEEKKKKCKLQYEENNAKIFTKIKCPSVTVNTKDIRTFLEENIDNIKILSKKEYLESWAYKSTRNISLAFPIFNKLIRERFENMTEFEKRCASLEFGKETGFIDDVINDDIQYVTFETIQKILKFFNLENSDMLYFINKRIEQKSNTKGLYKITSKFIEDI